ncbi:hypothetical protein EV715DRAFT_215393 [Schizophyllum commune]
MAPSTTPRYRTHHHIELRPPPGERRYEIIPLDHRPIPSSSGLTRTVRNRRRAAPYPAARPSFDEQSSSDVEGDASATRFIHRPAPAVSGTSTGVTDAEEYNRGTAGTSPAQTGAREPGRHRRRPVSMASDDSCPIQEVIKMVDALDWEQSHYTAVKDWTKEQVNATLDLSKAFGKQNEALINTICERVRTST